MHIGFYPVDVAVKVCGPLRHQVFVSSKWEVQVGVLQTVFVVGDTQVLAVHK
jgi:hypothetical protein